MKKEQNNIKNQTEYIKCHNMITEHMKENYELKSDIDLDNLTWELLNKIHNILEK